MFLNLLQQQGRIFHLVREGVQVNLQQVGSFWLDPGHVGPLVLREDPVDINDAAFPEQVHLLIAVTLGQTDLDGAKENHVNFIAFVTNLKE